MVSGQIRTFEYRFLLTQEVIVGKGQFGNDPLVGKVAVEDPFGDRLWIALIEVLQEVVDYVALGAPPPHSYLHHRYRLPG